MKVYLNVTLKGLEKKINRQIIINENISLIDLCEWIIVSLNGTKIPEYELKVGIETYYPDNSDIYKTIINKTSQFLIDNKTKNIIITYNYKKWYEIGIRIDNIKKEENNIPFEIISGTGYGLIDKKGYYLYNLLKYNEEQKEKYCNKEEREFINKKFDLEEINSRIKDYIQNKKELIKQKKYIFNVSLDGFNKEIKRKIIVNNDIIIDEFCRKVIISMNGDLSHEYGIKIGKDWVEEQSEYFELFYLNLKEKSKIKIIYDFGDNWTFNLTLSKIIDEYDDNDFQVLSGKGYGIIDDCGGPWGLQKIFDGEDDSWGNYDINDFDLEKCNKRVNN